MDIPGILRAQALSLRVQADRMEQLAGMVESGEIPANSKVVIDINVDPEARIRNVLAEVPSMRQRELADKLDLKPADVRKLMLPLIADRKVGSIKGGDRDWVYSWLWDPADTKDPTEARTQSPRPSSAPGGVAPLSERGDPVRIRTTRKMGRALSTPGSRGHHRRAEQAYERQRQAREERAAAQAEKQRAKNAAKPKKKDLSPTAEARRAENRAKAERDKARRGTETRKGAKAG